MNEWNFVPAISVFPTLFGRGLVAHRAGCLTGEKKAKNLEFLYISFNLESVKFLLELIQIYISMFFILKDDDLAAVIRDSSQ